MYARIQIDRPKMLEAVRPLTRAPLSVTILGRFCIWRCPMQEINVTFALSEELLALRGLHRLLDAGDDRDAQAAALLRPVIEGLEDKAEQLQSEVDQLFKAHRKAA